MADLDDAFFKKNVPGRYSSWAENDSDDDKKNQAITSNNDIESGDDDSEDDEFYFQDLPNHNGNVKITSATKSSSLSPSSLMNETILISDNLLSHSKNSELQSNCTNTGVKGVISDYIDARREEQLILAEQRLQRLQLEYGLTRQGTSLNLHENDVIKKEINGDDDDDHFFKQYRSLRLQKLYEASNIPIYGTYTSLSPEEYVDLVNKIDPRTYVVVHLYAPDIPECVVLHATLDKLAHCMEYVKFIEVRAFDAKPDLDGVCLPTILIYRGGELVYDMVRFMDGSLSSGRRNGAICRVEEVREVLEQMGLVDPRCDDYNT